MSHCGGAESRLRCVLPFAAVPAEVPLLRRAVVRQLSRWGLPTVTGEAELIVTELATNVVKHVGEGASATLVLECRGGLLRVEVHDRSRVMPSVTEAGCDAECGRGLHLLRSLATDWGAEPTAAGKAVWCETALTREESCPQATRASRVIENYQRSREADAPGEGQLVPVLEESAIELIADLLHWTAERGRDPEEILDRAQTRYAAEAA